MSVQDSNKIDTFFLDRIAKPPRQQHDTAPEDRHKEGTHRTFDPYESPHSEPLAEDPVQGDSDEELEEEPVDDHHDVPVDDRSERRDPERRSGGLTGTELMEMSYGEVIDEYHKLKSRCKEDKGFRKHFRTVCKDVNKMLKEDKDYNRAFRWLATIGKIVMVLSII